jgi:glyoxylase-like metal-dependent hydrolase (beta-lactamase superfamily II)/8-oxo-dGTP pyrophosphatase MutT (NUDIX family)
MTDELAGAERSAVRAEPVPPIPIPAATVVLVRPGSTGPEVLLTRRPASMAFAADMYVYPGGRVDPGDADRAVADRSVLTAPEAARGLGGDLPADDALAAYVAAIRELFEEAGVLLADGPGAQVVPRSLVAAARTALVGGDASFATIAAELGLTLRTDLLVPLSRWVTPPTMPRRFDARFFVAELPDGARVSFEGDEVADHAWHTPGDALRAMAAGEAGMWVPTSATLQQLEHAGSVAEMRDRLAPGSLGAIEVHALGSNVTRIVMPAGGGVAGQPVCAYLVGRQRHVLVDPGDPTGPSLERAIELAAARGGSIAAIALTHVDPDHAAGSEALAEMLGIPIVGGPGAGDPVPYEVATLADLERLDACDVPIRAVHAPGPRPDHVAFLVGEPDAIELVIGGDLDGRRGARAIVGPVDETALAASRARLRALAPGAAWLGGHPGLASRVDVALADRDARRHA